MSKPLKIFNKQEESGSFGRGQMYGWKSYFLPFIWRYHLK